MSEIEISSSLPQLTESETKARTEQNRALGRNSAISLYLFVKQGGLQRAGMGLDAYCAEVYGVDGRTGRYWIQQVTATLLAKDVNEQSLLVAFMTGHTETPLLPVALSAEICRLPVAEAVETYREWGKTRGDEKGSQKARVEDFKKIHARKFPAPKVQSEAEIISETPKTELTVNFEQPYELPLEDDEDELIMADDEEEIDMGNIGSSGMARAMDMLEEPKVQPDCTMLTAVRVEHYPQEFFWSILARDADGKEYTIDLPQKLMDLAPRKG